MQPILAAGLINLGKHLIDSFTGGDKPAAAQAQGTSFGQQLNAAQSALEAPPPSRVELISAVRNQPEVTRFLDTGSGQGDVFIESGKNGDFSIVTLDGRRLDIEPDSETHRLATQLFALHGPETTPHPTTATGADLAPRLSLRLPDSL